MLDKYQQLCSYIMELSEQNRIGLNKARIENDIYGHEFFDLLAVEDNLYLIAEKIKEINKNDWSLGSGINIILSNNN